MGFKISTYLLLLLPFLVNSDSNTKHLEKRSLIEAFSSNPKFISVFQNPDPSKTLIQKFMGDNYNRQYATTNNAQYTFYYPAGSGYNQENYNNDDEVVPDCVHTTPRIIKPKVPIIKDDLPVIVVPDPGQFIDIRNKEEKKIEPLNHLKHPTPTNKPYVPGTFLEINRELEKNKKETNNDFVQIPKYVYTPRPNQNINKYQEKTIPINSQKVPQVHENVNEGRKKLFNLKENQKVAEVSEYPDQDQLQIQLTKIFPPPSGSYDDREESYTIENVRNFKDFEELFNHSKMMPLMRPMGLANNPTDKKIKTNHFLTDPDPRNPPAPLEQQPNLLLISDWLEMSKKLYDTLLPEEKRRAYDLNKAIVSKRKYKGNNPNYMSPDVALKLLKDEYLVAERDADNDKKYNKHKSTINEDNNKNNDKNIHVVHKNVHFIGPQSDQDIIDVISTINNRFESEIENDTLLIKKNKDNTLSLINVLPTNNTNKHNNKVGNGIKPLTKVTAGKNNTVPTVNHYNDKKTVPKPINNKKNTIGTFKLPGSTKHRIINNNRDLNSIFVIPAQNILNNNGKNTNRTNKKIVTPTVTDNKSTKPSTNNHNNVIAPKSNQNIIDIIKSINNRYENQNENDTKKYDIKPLNGVIKNTTINDNHQNNKPLTNKTIKNFITTETGPDGKVVRKNVTVTTINQYNDNKTAPKPMDNKDFNIISNKTISKNNTMPGSIIEMGQLPGSNKKIVKTIVTDNTKSLTNNGKNIHNDVNFVAPKSEQNIIDIIQDNKKINITSTNNTITKKQDDTKPLTYETIKNSTINDNKPLTYKTIKNFITTEKGPDGKMIRKNVTVTTINQYTENKTAPTSIIDNNKLSKNIVENNKIPGSTTKMVQLPNNSHNDFDINSIFIKPAQYILNNNKNTNRTITNKKIVTQDKSTKPSTSTNNNFRDTFLNTLLSLRPKTSQSTVNNNNNVISARSAVDPIPSVSEITNILSGIFQEFSQPAVKERGRIK